MTQTPEQIDRPFLIEHKRLNETLKNYTPQSRLHLTSDARIGGFLRVLTGAQARILLVFMSSVSANGDIHVTAAQIARALGIPTPVAAAWLYQFSKTKFRGDPVIERLKWEPGILGLTIYALSQNHIRHLTHPPAEDPIVIQESVGRDRVVEHVRKTYATPRAEAERTVMLHLGLHPEELDPGEQAFVWRELRYLRFKRRDIESLVDAFGIKRITQQLVWLNDRRPKNRARTLVSSLMENWSPPRHLHDVLKSGKFAQVETDTEHGSGEQSNPEEGAND